MRAPVLVLAVAALVALGCGDDGDEPADRKPVTAAAFIECFGKAGFEAKRPAPREESVLAFQARREGYRVEPVNVYEGEMITPAAFLVFFESPEKAAEAMKELKATSYGEVAPAVRGPAVIGYGDRENRAAVGPAIDGCVG
ncbi:MAG TPA: hypothetical protein VF715_02900 [Thermoleophilaceae bacterium]|jgi:hypothetical protein